jgi:tetratricopeptide (TPR) repeat protein
VPVKVDKVRSREHFNQAFEAYFDGDRQAAIKHANMAIVHHLKWSRPHWLLGMIYTLMEPIDREEAIREYREVIRKDPMWAHGHFHLGNNLAKQGRMEEAVKSLREAVRLDSKSVWFRGVLAHALLKQKDYREAITVLRARPSLSPFYTLADGYLMLGQTWQSNPNLAHLAEEVWREILTLDESIPANRPANAEARKWIQHPENRESLPEFNNTPSTLSTQEQNTIK